MRPRQRASSSGSIATSSANTSNVAIACLHISPPPASGHVQSIETSVRSGMRATTLAGDASDVSEPPRSGAGSANSDTLYASLRLPNTSPATSPDRTSMSITAPSRA